MTGGRVRILIATGNAGKVREIAAILAPLPIQLLRIDDLTDDNAFDLGPPPNVLEDGATFAANAAKKAIEFARWSGLPTIGEDSGLVVDILGGAPGVYSARYAGPEATDAANNAKLVAEVARYEQTQRTARFRSAVALADSRDLLARSHGYVEGQIVTIPQGENGFGYDPLFYVPEFGCTTAQMPPEQKNRISHRGQAFRELLPQLRQLLNDGWLR